MVQCPWRCPRGHPGARGIADQVPLWSVLSVGIVSEEEETLKFMPHVEGQPHAFRLHPGLPSGHEGRSSGTRVTWRMCG